MVGNSGLEPKIQFGAEVNELARRSPGRLDSEDKPKKFQARTVVMASGPLPDHKWPDIRGLDTYEGHQIHSARWITTTTSPASGRCDRHRRECRPDHPESSSKPNSSRSSSAPPAGCCHGSMVPPRCGLRCCRQSAGRLRACATGTLLGHEITATALVWDTPLTGLVARLGGAPARQVKDPGCGATHPDFTPGWQADAGLQAIIPALQRDNCKLIDWPIATVSPGRHPHQRGIDTTSTASCSPPATTCI